MSLDKKEVFQIVGYNQREVEDKNVVIDLLDFGEKQR